jgi:hypothetical protein
MASYNPAEATAAIQWKCGVPTCQIVTTQRKGHEFPVRALSEFSSIFRELWASSRELCALHILLPIAVCFKIS